MNPCSCLPCSLRLSTPFATWLLLGASLLFSSAHLGASESPALLDDFSDPVQTSTGTNRMVVDDTSVGGKSRLEQTFANGVLSAAGEITPGRGQPGWVNLILLFSPGGEAADLSRFEGIRIKVRVRQGMLSVAANSTEITNFDYHSTVIPRKGDELQEVRIPFRDLKRNWSEQIPLNPATIGSISLVAVGFQPGPFAYDVDEVGFY